MISYQQERFIDCIQEAGPLLWDHWKEIGLYQDVRPLNPDMDKYAQLEDLGLIRVYTVRDSDVLCGYASFIVAPLLHYQQWCAATNDIYFIQETHRRGWTAYRFFRFVEDQLRAEGVNSVYFPDKVHKSKAKLFQRLGYTAMETKFEKVL